MNMDSKYCIWQSGEKVCRDNLIPTGEDWNDTFLFPTETCDNLPEACEFVKINATFYFFSTAYLLRCTGECVGYNAICTLGWLSCLVFHCCGLRKGCSALFDEGDQISLRSDQVGMTLGKVLGNSAGILVAGSMGMFTAGVLSLCIVGKLIADRYCKPTDPGPTAQLMT